jgi:osmotically-inducible protein OsmY
MSKQTPTSYDDIVRRTVPDPDSSQRPSEHQEQQAREGFRAMDAHEAVLAARVQSAAEGVDVEVDRDTVTLRGQVRDAQAISRIEDAVRRIDGVGSVNNRLVVG